MSGHRVCISVGFVAVVVAVLVGVFIGSNQSSGSKSPTISTPDAKTVTCLEWANLSVKQKDLIAGELTSNRGRIDAGCGASDNPDYEPASQYAK